MTLTDEQLLDFDPARLADFEIGEAKARLAQIGDVYRAHLTAARLLSDYRERWLRQVAANPHDVFSEEYTSGWTDGIGEAIAHLRQGDLAPGAPWHDEGVADIKRG